MLNESKYLMPWVRCAFGNVVCNSWTTFDFQLNIVRHPSVVTVVLICGIYSNLSQVLSAVGGHWSFAHLRFIHIGARHLCPIKNFCSFLIVCRCYWCFYYFFCVRLGRYGPCTFPLDLLLIIGKKPRTEINIISDMDKVLKWLPVIYERIKNHRIG